MDQLFRFKVYGNNVYSILQLNAVAIKINDRSTEGFQRPFCNRKRKKSILSGYPAFDPALLSSASSETVKRLKTSLESPAQNRYESVGLDSSRTRKCNLAIFRPYSDIFFIAILSHGLNRYPYSAIIKT